MKKFMKEIIFFVVATVGGFLLLMWIDFPSTARNCEELASRIEGEELQNVFGVKSEILKINKVTEISRQIQTEKVNYELICKGTTFLNPGGEATIRFRQFKDDDGDMFMEIEEI